MQRGGSHEGLKAGQRRGYVDRYGYQASERARTRGGAEAVRHSCDRTNGEMDPNLAAAMEEVYQASLRNPDNFYNNPRKHREALEGLGRLLAECQEENGAFTNEELEAARLSLYGELPSMGRRIMNSPEVRERAVRLLLEHKDQHHLATVPP